MMKNKISYLFTIFLVTTSSIDVKAQKASDLFGEWSLIKQTEQLYDGSKLVRTEDIGIEEGSLTLHFGKNFIVDYIFTEDESIKYKYKINGKNIDFSPLDPNAAEPMFYNFKIVDGFLFMYLEIIDDPGVEGLKDPSLKMEFVFEQDTFYPS